MCAIHSLTLARTRPQLVDIEPLRATVADYFTETGILKYGLYDKTAALSKVFGAFRSLA